MARKRQRYRVGQTKGAWVAIRKGWRWYLGRVRYYGANRWRVGSRSATEAQAIVALLETVERTLPKPPTKYTSRPQRRYSGRHTRWIWCATDLNMSLERAQQEIAKENAIDGAEDPEADLLDWRGWQTGNRRAPWFTWCKRQGKVLIQYSVLVEKGAYPGRRAFAVNEIWNGNYRKFDANKLTAYRDLKARIDGMRKSGEITFFEAGFWLRWKIGMKHETPSRKTKKASRKMDSR